MLFLLPNQQCHTSSSFLIANVSGGRYSMSSACNQSQVGQGSDCSFQGDLVEASGCIYG